MYKTQINADNILDKATVRKSLPDNFFEKVMDLQLHIKRDFSQAVLQELVGMYTVYLFFIFSSPLNIMKV